MTFELIDSDENQTEINISAEEAQQYIQEIFSAAKPLKQKRDEIEFEAQQKEAEKMRKRDNKEVDPHNVLLKNYMAPDLGEAREAYQGCLEQLMVSPLTTIYQEALATHQQSLLQRMDNLKRQKADAGKRLVELQEEQVTTVDDQTDVMAEALARGEDDALPTIKKQQAPVQDDIDNEREELRSKIPALERAILMLSNDSQLYDDMGAQLRRNLLLQEYRRQQPAFADALAMLKPMYEECMSISKQLGLYCEEKKQLIELVEQQQTA